MRPAAARKEDEDESAPPVQSTAAAAAQVEDRASGGWCKRLEPQVYHVLNVFRTYFAIKKAGSTNQNSARTGTYAIKFDMLSLKQGMISCLAYMIS
jgi:hypothetical protein